jgi:hypothetical protein
MSLVAGRPKWGVHTEDVDMYRVTELGVFDTRGAAIAHIRQKIVAEIEADDDGYQDWLSEPEGEASQNTPESHATYVAETTGELDEKMTPWGADEGGEFRWGIYMYVLTEVPYYPGIV